MIKLKLFHIAFLKAKPVAISFTTFKRESYLVVLKYKGLEGIGAANPFKPITGDSPKDLMSDVKKIINIPLNPEKDDLKTLHKYLEKKIISRSLMSAIDAAYHDLIGKLKNIPIYKLYFKNPRYVNNSITIFLKDPIKETKKEVRAIYRKFPDLKVLKIKLKGKNDIERVRAIKEVSSQNMIFTLDANQAYKDPKEAVKALTDINRILKNTLLVEEPCKKGNLKGLKFVADNLKGIMVFADESAATLDDVKKIINKKAAHGINIKLQKAGGIYPSMKIAELCRKAGLKVMVGAMIEDTVSLTAAAHFAVANKNIILTDLDTDIDIPRYIDGGSIIKNGKRVIAEKPGLGINFDIERLKKLSLKKELYFRKMIL